MNITFQENRIHSLARKWYRRLGFPTEFDIEFTQLLEQEQNLSECTIENYEIKNTDEYKGKNLIMFLYFCEELATNYRRHQISEQILTDTLSDIVFWTKTQYELTHSLGLAEPNWLKNHLSFRLFRIGRLQFRIGACASDISALSVKKGDSVLEVHIPAGESLSPEVCLASFTAAEKFYAKYFPQQEYACFTCNSWLLDKGLNVWMRSDSNIIKFGELFTEIEREESFAILKYTMSWNATRENLKETEPKTSFAKQIKEAVLAGETFYETLGYREKSV